MATVEETVETLEAEAKPPSISRLEHNVENIASKLASLTSKVDTLDATLAMLASSIERVESKMSELNNLIYIAVSMGEWKRRTCRHHHNGLCRAWRVSDGNTSIPAVIDENGIRRPYVAKKPLLCAFCPLYEPA